MKVGKISSDKVGTWTGEAMNTGTTSICIHWWKEECAASLGEPSVVEHQARGGGRGE